MRTAFLFSFLVSSLLGAASFEGKVVGVSDGDTLTVLDGQQVPQKIRLEGLDSPEKKQAFGTQAKKHLSDLAYGKTAIVQFKKRDRYGRILGKVMVEGKDVALEQVKAGFGWHYKQYSRQQEPTDQATYAQAETQARQQKLGLWSDPNPTAPWDFRRGARQNRRAGRQVAQPTPSNPAEQDNAVQ